MWQQRTINGTWSRNARIVKYEDLARALKRAIDIIVGGILLVLASPIIAVAGCFVKLNSRGSAFFIQERCGKNGRSFRMIKMRSMVVDAEAQRTNLESANEQSGPVFKIKHDPRITAVGRFLRKTSIDELPQLWHVVCGDMSLVGPRPPIPKEVAQYDAWQRRRLSVTPGITCIWQVSGRSRIGFDEWVKLDLYYIDHWSLWLDIKILVKTIAVVFSCRDAY